MVRTQCDDNTLNAAHNLKKSSGSTIPMSGITSIFSSVYHHADKISRVAPPLKRNANSSIFVDVLYLSKPDCSALNHLMVTS